jgi:hypothetical protein
MDAHITDQQLMLQQAGVPGFFVTTDPEHIKTQAKVLELLRSFARS